MISLLFSCQSDGPSAELDRQLQLSKFFDACYPIQDFDDLGQRLSRCQEPVSAFVLLPQDETQWPVTRSISEILALCERAHRVVLCLNEIDMVANRLSDLTQIPNLWIMAPAQHNFGVDHRPMVLWQHWIQDLAHVWQAAGVKAEIDHIRDSRNRPYLFDVLLGGERDYRTLLHDLIESDAVLRDQVIMSYYGMPTTRPRFIAEPDLVPIAWQDPMHTGIRVRYRGVEMRLSCVPPLSIYQQSWFTVLAETSAHSVLNFYTEKVAKPLLAGRLFLVLAGQHYLRGLRDAGFQTFQGVIDESYDLEPDNRTRWSMVFHEMQRLSRCDPSQLLEQVQPILRHNQQRAWNQDFIQQAILTAKQQIQQPI